MPPYANPIATDGLGNQLVEFVPGETIDVIEAQQDKSVTFAVTIIKHQGKTVFVFNRSRKHWELPGGRVDPGETPLDCAIRETFEECNQTISALVYKGVMKVYLANQDACFLGALYATELDMITPFEPNNEMDRMYVWDLQEALDGVISGIDVKLVELGA